MGVRRTSLKPNKRGRYRRELGYVDQARTKRVRFDLGSNKHEAEHRAERLLQLFEESMRVMEGQDVWTPLALDAAKQIATGVYSICYDPVWETLRAIDDEPTVQQMAAEYVQMLRVEQRSYPSLHIVPGDEQLYVLGVRVNETIETDALGNLAEHFQDLGVITAHRKYPNQIVSGTLHEALDAYSEHIEATGKRLDENTLKPWYRKQLDYVECLKRHHSDQPLWELADHDAIEKLFSYWENRPKHSRGGRYKPTSVKFRCTTLKSFLKWLDQTSKYTWVMPKGIEQRRLRIVELEEDHQQASLMTKDVYNPEQLGLLAAEASEFERFLLLASVNCAFGAAELGRLTIDEIILRTEHEYAERLHFDSTDEDSFIRLLRPKTKVFGEWLLWPETAGVVERAMLRARRLGSQYLACNDDGEVLYSEKRKKPDGRFANRWNSFVERVQESHPGLPRLPYGSLRDTLPDVLRHCACDELASICLAHKGAYKPDHLLECYGNKPYGKLHEAIRGVREYFRPMLRHSE